MTKITQENLLINTFPEIAAQFDIERNTKSLNEVSYGSDKKVWWKCPVCHGSWEAAPYNRTLNNEGCPYCSPKHPKPHMGYCLGTEHPEVLPFWDYTRNNEEGYTPRNINSEKSQKSMVDMRQKSRASLSSECTTSFQRIRTMYRMQAN